MSESENTFNDAPAAKPVSDLPEEVLKYKVANLSRVFASGGKRLLRCIDNGNNTVHPIHAQLSDTTGMNFMGNLTNSKQHIQFLKYIRGECSIPDTILPLFLKAYKNVEDAGQLKESFLNLSFFFNKCEAFIFQISSLDIAEKDGFQVCNDVDDADVKCYKQTAEDLQEDIQTIISLIPEGRKIIFANDLSAELVLGDSVEKNPDLEIITTQLQDIITPKIRFFNYNDLKKTPFFTQIFERNSCNFTPMGLGFVFILLNEYCIKP